MSKLPAAEASAKEEKDAQRTRIYLLEVILDELRLSYCTEFMHRCQCGPNFLSVRFLDQPAMSIYENAPVLAECAQMKTGASSLFALDAEAVAKARQEFVLRVQLQRDTPDGALLLGGVALPITQLMKCVTMKSDAYECRRGLDAVATKQKQKQKQKLPCMPAPKANVFSENIHETLVAMAVPGTSCDEAALLSVYVRLSCFGAVMISDCRLEAKQVEDNVPDYVECPVKCPPCSVP